MGQEEEATERRKIFMPFQVNQTLFSKAAKHAVFMHCLPAHRGDEVTATVIDSPRSVVFDQAENRLHIQKAIMVLLLEGGSHRFPPRSAHA
jgi:ornithine carbamoyltransferase